MGHADAGAVNRGRREAPARPRPPPPSGESVKDVKTTMRRHELRRHQRKTPRSDVPGGVVVQSGTGCANGPMFLAGERDSKDCYKHLKIRPFTNSKMPGAPIDAPGTTTLPARASDHPERLSRNDHPA